MALGGQILECSIDNENFDMGEGASVSVPHYENTGVDLVTGRTEFTRKFKAGMINLPLKATRGVTVQTIIDLFERANSGGRAGATVSIVTNAMRITGSECFLEGTPTQQLDDGNIEGVVIKSKSAKGIEIEEFTS